jgi:hypothetical protein
LTSNQCAAANRRPAGQSDGWDFRQLTYAFIVGFVFQQLFLACLCDIGTAKITLALVVDALVIVRAAVAYVSRERGRGWLFYAILLYTSTGWIMIVSRIILGPDGW